MSNANNITISFSGISRLKEGPLRLRPRKNDTIPRPSQDLLRSIKDFARYYYLPEIPAPTVERLRTDPDFKYCFIVSADHFSLYDPEGYGRRLADQLIRTILDPYSISAREISFGMRLYINNFHCNLPDGFYRTVHADADQTGISSISRIFNNIDILLKENDQAAKLQQLKTSAEMEAHRPSFSFDDLERYNADPIGFLNRQYRSRLEYARFCLSLMHQMIDRFGHSAEELVK